MVNRTETSVRAVSELAQSFPVLSCDIFDTAVGRILARPEDVLLAVGARALAEGLITYSPDAFAVYRQAAEVRARARAESAGHDEVRIAEIYDDMYALGILAEPVRAARLEFEVECAVCRPIAPVQEMLVARAASGSGDHLIFASDSCLPGLWLAELLQSCGYGTGFRVFASSVRLNG